MEGVSRSRHPDSLGQAFLWALLPSLVLFLIAPSVGDAQEATNITPSDLPDCPGPCGPGVTIVDPLPPGQGGTVTITGGARPGNGPNLFHSFGQFDVGPGGIANFFNETALPTSNIVSRVTGGNPSQIYGTIRTTNFPGANLFLMNPAGVLFGANAQLDLGGSFFATTADYLNFGDDNGTSPFYADPAKASVLSVAPVAAFGFLALEPGVTRGTISVQGSILEVPEGQSLSLVGGDITVQAGTLEDGTIQAASLRAPGGHLTLVSVASPGKVLVPSFQTESFTSMGTVTIKEGATLDVSGQVEFDADGNPIGGNSGTVFVRAGQLVMDASFIKGNTVASVDGAPTAVDVEVLQGVTLTTGASIITETFGPGLGGDVQITAATIDLDGFGTAITTQTWGAGNAGHITAKVGTLSLTNGAAINSINVGGQGQGGNVTVQGLPKAADGAAESVTLKDFATITAQTQFGPGPGGDVSITAGTLLIDSFSRVTSESFFGTGTGGELVLNVGNLTVGGVSSVGTFNTTFEFDVDGDGVLDPGSVGVGGNLTIQGISGTGAADSVVLSGSFSEITSITGDGAGGSLSITTTSLSLSDLFSISSSTGGKGGGGAIALSVQNASLSGGATIASRTTFFGEGAGAGGNIMVRGLDGIIKADFLEMEGFRSGIISDSSGLLSQAGAIEVHARTVSLTDGAVIEGGNPFSLGTPGNVDIVADSVRIVGTAGVPELESHISSQNFGLNAGQVTITANQLTLDNGSIVTSTGSFTGGSGGNIEVNVNAVSLANGSTINSSTSGTGRAGDIRIAGGQLVTVDSGSSITANTTGQGDAGNVLVSAGAVTVTNGSEISTSAQPPAGFLDQPSDLIGNAGDIVIEATGNSLLVSNGGTIASVSETGGKAGTIHIFTPSLTLDSGIITTSASSTGNAGSITADVGTLTLTNDAEISSSSIGTILNAGDAGNITTYVSGSFTSNGGKVSTSAENAKGGDILIDAQNVQLSNGTLISASSNAPLLPDGAGNAGNITITSASNVVMQNSKVTTEASAASGGSIEINASDTGMVQLTNSTVSTSVGGVAGSNGGNISIDPQFVVLQNSQIIAQAFAGAGGAINIIATSAFIADPNSTIDASSTLGISGTVNIQSPLQNIGGELAALSEEFSSAAALLAQQCAARVADGKFSTFVIAAREGLPAEPGGFLASPSLTTELLGLRLSGRDAQTQLSAVTGLFPKYDAKPIQLAKLGSACHR